MSLKYRELTHTLHRYWHRCPGWLQSLMLGLLMGLSFMQPYLAPLLLVALPVYWWHIMRAPTIYKAAWYGWLVWYVKSVFAVSWLWSTYPLVWVSLSDSAVVQLSAITFYVATVSLWLSSAGLLIGVGIWYIQRAGVAWWLRIILGTVLVVGAEVFATTVFAVANLGPNIPITSGFSYGLIGLPLAQLPGAIGWSTIYGLYGLSAVMAGYTLGCVWGIRAWRGYWVGGGLLLILVGGWALLALNQSHNDSVRTEPAPTIAVIETDFTADLLDTEVGHATRLNRQHAAFTAAMSTDAKYVIFPEDARFVASLYPMLSAREAYNYLRLEYNDFDTVVIDSARIESSAGAALRATIYDGVAKTVSQVDKQYLVPQGEYVPYFYSYIFWALGYAEVVDKLEQAAYRPGPYSSPTHQADYLPAILFCFASSHASGVVDLYDTTEHALPFVAHLISHAWFHSPLLLWYQTDQFLRIQSVWQQVPIVSAGNMAPSKVYLPDGSVTQGPVVASGEGWRVRLVTLP